VCAYPKELQEVAAYHGEFRPPNDWEHNSRRYIVRLVPPVPGLWTCFTHAPCVCNEIVSARNRVLGKVPLPTTAGLKELRAEMKAMARRAGHMVPWTDAHVLESFVGSRRARYVEALESLRVKPLCPADARIQSFVKAEKFNPGDKENPDPRMIQARSPRYNIAICRYLRPVEHHIYRLVDSAGVRMVAKGLNQRDRAQLLVDKFGMFADPVCFSIDCSRWDKHVSKKILEVEHSYYRKILPNHPEFDRLLDQQLVNRCRCAAGTKYVVNGGRMSGDINTALGNCLLMVMMARAAMKSLGVRSYQLLDDGDDCLVIVERGDFDLVREKLPEKYLAYGQELKIENIAYKVSEVLFCQSRVVFNGEYPIFVRDWRKVLSHACCGTKHWNVPEEVRPMLGLVGTCELALGAGVPILQAFAQALIRNSRGKIAKIVNLEAGLGYRIKNEYGQVVDLRGLTKARQITAESRVSFEDAFGVPIWEQEAIESILDRWTITTEVAKDVPTEWDYSWNDYRQLEVLLPELF